MGYLRAKLIYLIKNVDIYIPSNCDRTLMHTWWWWQKLLGFFGILLSEDMTGTKDWSLPWPSPTYNAIDTAYGDGSLKLVDMINISTAILNEIKLLKKYCCLFYGSCTFYIMFFTRCMPSLLDRKNKHTKKNLRICELNYLIKTDWYCCNWCVRCGSILSNTSSRCRVWLPGNDSNVFEYRLKKCRWYWKTPAEDL